MYKLINSVPVVNMKVVSDIGVPGIITRVVPANEEDVALWAVNNVKLGDHIVTIDWNSIDPATQTNYYTQTARPLSSLSDVTVVGLQHELHKLDTQDSVYFYEQDFYVLSNFSAFTVHRHGIRFDTAEHAYHWEKFNYPAFSDKHEENLRAVREAIRLAPSAHEAYKRAQDYKEYQDAAWYDNREAVMREILIDKINQHEYVKRKLLDTGYRELIEDSWRDDFWGWGPNKDGQNKLGKIWVSIRDDIREGKL